MPKLTIGMATSMDFHGVYFTIQSLRLYHADVMDEVELVVVDQAPNTQHGRDVRNIVERWATIGTAGARYAPMINPAGTSPSRNKVFQLATGDAVMCIDCHIMLVPGAVRRLLEYYEANPKTMDLLQGPLMYDNMHQFTTHFNDVWRAEMWGVWGQAWRCPCGVGGIEFSPVEGKAGQTRYVLLKSQTPIVKCHRCSKPLPGDQPLGSIKWHGHDARLRDEGYYPLGIDNNDPPFEIPSQGLGLFSCRKEAWLQFNKYTRGFGGEEGYIHEKFRQSGAKALCLPFLKWLHRFGRPDGVFYKLTRYNKVRNYVLEFLELGLDIGVIYDHFVNGVGMPDGMGTFSQKEWDHIVADPEANFDPPEGCRGCGDDGANGVPSDLDDAFDFLKRKPRDLNEHMDKLKEVAGNCEHVSEMTHRRESTVALAAARPSRLRSYNVERDTILDRLDELETIDITPIPSRSIDVDSFEETDMLFIDTRHTADQLTYELENFAPKVRKYIVLHDTKLHGEHGEDGGPGLLAALRRYMRENPEWIVVYHVEHQFGLTVISRDPADRENLPSLPTMAWNYSKAMAKHLATPGDDRVTEEEAAMRLDTCSLCPKRNEGRCSACGCFLVETPHGQPGKALYDSSVCPLGYWDHAKQLGKPLVPLVS